MLSRSLFSDSSLARYNLYRAEGMKLNNKINKAYMTKPVLLAAARKLGISRNGQLFFDSEDEMSVFMDFGFYEMSIGGKTAVQLYQEEHGGSNKIEKELLIAMAAAKTSLFFVESIDKSNCHMELQELVGEKRKLTLTDIGFSQTLTRNIIIFFRPIELADFMMTSGVTFAFPGKLEKELVNKWKKWSRDEYYPGFFRLSKNKGISVRYE
jgi:hypothetical protein